MKLIAIDTETTGLDPINNSLIGIGYAYDEINAYVKFGQTDPFLVNALRSEEYHKIFHNAVFDLAFLRNNGFEINGQIYDTKHLAYLTDENSQQGLKPLSIRYLGADSVKSYNKLLESLEREKKKFGELSTAPFEDVAEYCKEDARNTLQLFHVLSKKFMEVVKKQKKLGFSKTVKDYLFEEFNPTESFLLKLNQRGIRLNTDLINLTKQTLVSEIRDLTIEFRRLGETQICEIEEFLWQKERAKRKTEKGKAGVKKPEFNIDSNAHLGMLLQSMGIQLPTTKTGALKVDSVVLEELQKKLTLKLEYSKGKESKTLGIVTILIEYREKNKLLTTYIEGFLARAKGVRIFPKYFQIGHGKTELGSEGTVSGRLSSRDPNAQNLPRGPVVKRFLIPDSQDHVFIYTDYSQLELRLAAHASQDPEMVTAFRNGVDLHQITANAIFEGNWPKGDKDLARQVGKTVNFLLIYGGGANKLITTIKSATGLELSIEEAKSIRRKYFEKYFIYAEYLEKQKALLQQRGWVVSDYGLVRRLPDARLVNEGLKIDWVNPTYTGPRADEFLQIAVSKGIQTPTMKDIAQVAAGKFHHAINQGLNFPIQSAGASICKRTMLVLDQAGFDIVQQVHDSIVIQVLKTEIKEKKEQMKDIVENTIKLSIPLKADFKVTLSLDDKHTYEN